MSGAAAFAGTWNHRRTVPQYAWVPQLFAGRTVAELTSYARGARAQGTRRAPRLDADPGHAHRPGVRPLLRPAARADPYPPEGRIRRLRRLRAEPVTEVWSRGSASTPGTRSPSGRSLDRRGRITTWNEGCGGGVPASRGEAIPYVDGKRCWINQEIYGVHGAAAWQRQDPRHRTARPGHADTDATFVGDATGAHLVLNRNKSELMCRAYDDADVRW